MAKHTQTIRVWVGLALKGLNDKTKAPLYESSKKAFTFFSAAYLWLFERFFKKKEKIIYFILISEVS